MDSESLEFLRQFNGVGSVPLVVMATTATRRFVPKRYWPVLAVLWGTILSVLLSFAFRSDPLIAIVVGVFAGFLASDRYDKGKDSSGPNP